MSKNTPKQSDSKDLTKEKYTLALSSPLETLDGTPLLKTDTAQVIKKDDDGKEYVEEVKTPAEEYRLVDALMVIMDNMPFEYLYQEDAKMQDLYYKCVEFIRNPDKAEDVVEINGLTRHFLIHAAKHFNALSTFLTFEVDKRIIKQDK